MGAVDDALDALHNMADELGLEDDDRENFIESAMSRKGFKQRSTWAEPDADDSGNKGDFFTRQKSNRETRRVPPRGQGGGLTRYGS